MRRPISARMAGGIAAAASALLGCAEWRRPPLMAGYEAGAPLVHEQALVGLDAGGNAAALQLLDAEGRPAELELLVLDGLGGPTRHLLQAPAAVAAAAAAALRTAGREARPLLADVGERTWPAAVRTARERGFAAALPERTAPEWRIPGAPAAGALPLSLRVALEDQGDPPAFTLRLSLDAAKEAGPRDVELVRQPVAGAPIPGGLWISNRIVWLLSGSVGREPLRRTVGLRSASLSRGEASLHDLQGRAWQASGDLERARREFDLAIAADPAFFDGLYDAAAAAARVGKADEAIALLRRAALVDRQRVQVLGRDDADLKLLRRREDVRALLGLKRPPPE